MFHNTFIGNKTGISICENLFPLINAHGNLAEKFTFKEKTNNHFPFHKRKTTRLMVHENTPAMPTIQRQPTTLQKGNITILK